MSTPTREEIVEAMDWRSELEGHNPRYVAYAAASGANSCADAWARDRSGGPYMEWLQARLCAWRASRNVGIANRLSENEQSAFTTHLLQCAGLAQ